MLRRQLEAVTGCLRGTQYDGKCSFYLNCSFFRISPTNRDLREKAVYFPPWCTVTGGPFLRANMSKCKSDNKKKIHTGKRSRALVGALTNWEGVITNSPLASFLLCLHYPIYQAIVSYCRIPYKSWQLIPNLRNLDNVLAFWCLLQVPLLCLLMNDIRQWCLACGNKIVSIGSNSL